MSAEFLLTSLILCVMPGAGVVFTLAAALSGGFRPALIAAAACTLGIVPHVAASLLGLAAILHASATLYEGLRIAGVLYLLYMAVAMLRSGGGLAIEPRRAPATARRILRDALLINLLNPKLTLFFVAFLPQFVPVDAPHPSALMLALSGVFMAMTFVVFVVYGAIAASVRDAVVSRPAVMLWLRRSFAAAFGLLGLRLALADR